jgi:hypothetical protein
VLLGWCGCVAATYWWLLGGSGTKLVRATCVQAEAAPYGSQLCGARLSSQAAPTVACQQRAVCARQLVKLLPDSRAPEMQIRYYY